ncbi:MAG: hypothetical protein WB791_11305, partial [Waddliaceae bacterium]
VTYITDDESFKEIFGGDKAKSAEKFKNFIKEIGANNLEKLVDKQVTWSTKEQGSRIFDMKSKNWLNNDSMQKVANQVRTAFENAITKPQQKELHKAFSQPLTDKDPFDEDFVPPEAKQSSTAEMTEEEQVRLGGQEILTPTNIAPTREPSSSSVEDGVSVSQQNQKDIELVKDIFTSELDPKKLEQLENAYGNLDQKTRLNKIKDTLETILRDDKDITPEQRIRLENEFVKISVIQLENLEPIGGGGGGHGGNFTATVQVPTATTSKGEEDNKTIKLFLKTLPEVKKVEYKDKLDLTELNNYRMIETVDDDPDLKDDYLRCFGKASREDGKNLLVLQALEDNGDGLDVKTTGRILDNEEVQQTRGHKKSTGTTTQQTLTEIVTKASRIQVQKGGKKTRMLLTLAWRGAVFKACMRKQLGIRFGRRAEDPKQKASIQKYIDALDKEIIKIKRRHHAGVGGSLFYLKLNEKGKDLRPLDPAHNYVDPDLKPDIIDKGKNKIKMEYMLDDIILDGKRKNEKIYDARVKRIFIGDEKLTLKERRQIFEKQKLHSETAYKNQKKYLEDLKPKETTLLSSLREKIPRRKRKFRGKEPTFPPLG